MQGERNVWEFTITSLSLDASHVSSHTASPLFVSHFPVAFLGVFTKLGNATINILMSARPYGNTRLPLDGFS